MVLFAMVDFAVLSGVAYIMSMKEEKKDTALNGEDRNVSSSSSSSSSSCGSVSTVGDVIEAPMWMMKSEAVDDEEDWGYFIDVDVDVTPDVKVNSSVTDFFLRFINISINVTKK